MINRIHCSMAHHYASPADLANEATKVREGAKNLVLFPLSPITDTEWNTNIVNYVGAFANYEQGGITQKQPYLTCRGIILQCMDKTAEYVDIIAVGDPKIIILGGFIPTYFLPNQKAGEEAAPVVLNVKNGESSGIMIASCETFGLNHNYGCIVSEGGSLASNVFMNPEGQLIFPSGQLTNIIHDVSHSREKKFTGLKRGVDYYFYFYVVGVKSVSPLSLAVMMMSL